MKFTDLRYSEDVVDKLWIKHAVDLCEVEDILGGDYWLRRGRNNLYWLYGQTRAGRYLIVILAHLEGERCQLVTARNMVEGERRSYLRR